MKFEIILAITLSKNTTRTFANLDQLSTDPSDGEIFNCVLSLENEIAKLSQIAKFNHYEI